MGYEMCIARVYASKENAAIQVKKEFTESLSDMLD